jgi:glucosamine-6-phosphate deaminase
MTNWSPFERECLNENHDDYATEQIASLQVGNIYDLGKIVTLRFVEWCVDNPKGVVALPTGAMAEFFLKTLGNYKQNWDQVKEKVDSFKKLDSFPDTSFLTLVMTKEFFPILPMHKNSFCHAIRTSYVELLNIKPENLLMMDLLEEQVLSVDQLSTLENKDTIDLTLLQRDAKSPNEQTVKETLTAVQSFCDQYEQQIALRGGIGFFLGGIGPDGHIAFNQKDSSPTSTTRLVNFNYATAASLASDLGGIEKARQKLAMTIGLQTICKNPDATIILMVAGEGQAIMVKESLELPPDPSRPASAFHGHEGARFYITRGTASLLSSRKAETIKAISEEACKEWPLKYSGIPNDKPIHLVEPPSDWMALESLFYDTSLAVNIPVHELTLSHLDATREGKAAPAWLRNDEIFSTIRECAVRRLKDKVEGGLCAISVQDQTILHTAPHHDDIMLSYHAAMHEMLGSERRYDGSQPSGGHNNTNYFAYLTSGFNSVTDEFLGKWIDAWRGSGPDGNYALIHSLVENGTLPLTKDYDSVMMDFRNAFMDRKVNREESETAQERIESEIFLRKVAEVFHVSLSQSKEALASELISNMESLWLDYLKKGASGSSVLNEAKMLKGCMRESEVDRVWALSSMPNDRIFHLRSKFYMEKKKPTTEDDAMPVANLIQTLKPNLLSVAFDPEGKKMLLLFVALVVVVARQGSKHLG